MRLPKLTLSSFNGNLLKWQHSGTPSLLQFIPIQVYHPPTPYYYFTVMHALHSTTQHFTTVPPQAGWLI